MVSNELLNFFGAMLGGGIIGSIISALATKYYGERWVERFRIRRVHSEKINDEVLKIWLDKAKDYVNIGSTYSKKTDTMTANKPKDPIDLKFFYEAKSHMETKYPNILKVWEELKLVTSRHNEKLTVVLEEIRTAIIHEFKMYCYYWSLGAEEPEERIQPDKITQQIYREIESRAKYDRKWFSGEPRVTQYMTGDEKFFQLEWENNRVIRSQNEQKVKDSIPFIKQLVETSKFIENEKNLTKEEKEIYTINLEDFKTKIKDVIKSIELGNILKGTCKFCP